MPRYKIFFLLLFNVCCSESFSASDTNIIHHKLNLELAASFMNALNWRGNTVNNYFFNSTVHYNLLHNNSYRERNFTLQSETGFTKIVDSLWMKHLDELKIFYLSRKTTGKIQQSLSAHFSTQLFNSYDYSHGSRTGNFLNPADLESGYGVNVSLGNSNFINLSFATLRLRNKSKELLEPGDKEETIARFRNTYMVLDYGLSGQVSVFKQFRDFVEWHCKGKFFVNGFNKSNTTFDLSNKMSCRVWKYFQLRADISCVFDPVQSTKMQYRSELLLGIYYEWEKKH